MRRLARALGGRTLSGRLGRRKQSEIASDMNRAVSGGGAAPAMVMVGRRRIRRVSEESYTGRSASELPYYPTVTGTDW